MENGNSIILLIVAKLACCLLLPLGAAGFLGTITAWFSQIPIAWVLLALSAVAGGVAWAWSGMRNRPCPNLEPISAADGASDG